MNSLVKSGLFAIVFTLAISLGVVDASAQTKNEILRTMEQHKNALQSLKASVKMEEYEGALGDSLVRNGDVVYVPKKGRDALVRIDWVKPDETLIDELLRQRRYSLLFEGHYWIDMRRYDRLDQLPKDRANDVVHALFPIPTAEQDARPMQ